MISVLLLLVLMVVLVYRYLKEHYRLFERDGLPGPKPTLLLGNLPDFAKNKGDPLATFSELTKKFGKVFGYFEGLTPSVVVSDPVMIEQILVKHFHQFDQRPRCWPFVHGAEEYSLQNMNGPTWKHSRDAVASALRTSTIRKMWPRLHAVSKLFVQKLESARKERPDGINMSRENENYLLEAFTSAAFDVEPEAISTQDKSDLMNYMRSTHNSASPENHISGLSRVYPTLAIFFQLFDKIHKEMAAKHFIFVSKRLDAEREQMKKNVDNKPPSNLLQHFLSSAISSRDHANNIVQTPFSGGALQGMVSSFFGGGLGPAVSALDFTVYCLGANPEKQERLRREIANTFHGDEDYVSLDKVQGMEYLEMFISESLRHYPVAPGVARTCSEDCVVKGVRFRKGTAIRLMGYLQYRDPEVYPDPAKFEPERFSTEEKSKRHPYTFIPFGNGPRMCVAKRLGLLQVKLAVVALLQNFRIVPCSSTQVPLLLAHRPFLCPKDDVIMQLQPLETAPECVS